MPGLWNPADSYENHPHFLFYFKNIYLFIFKCTATKTFFLTLYKFQVSIFPLLSLRSLKKNKKTHLNIYHQRSLTLSVFVWELHLEPVLQFKTVTLSWDIQAYMAY